MIVESKSAEKLAKDSSVDKPKESEQEKKAESSVPPTKTPKDSSVANPTKDLSTEREVIKKAKFDTIKGVVIKEPSTDQPKKVVIDEHLKKRNKEKFAEVSHQATQTLENIIKLKDSIYPDETAGFVDVPKMLVHMTR